MHIFDFKGRMSRHSFWQFVLMMIFTAMLVAGVGVYVYTAHFNVFPVYLYGSIALGIVFLISFISAGCRRLRDVGFTTKGIMVLFILCVLTALAFSTVILLLALLPTDTFAKKKGRTAIIR